MKKHIKKIFGIIIAFLLCTTAFAQTKANPESDFKLIIPEFNQGEPYYVYVGKSQNVVIPKKEFYSDWLIRTPHTTVKVKSVVIPEGVTSIGYSAFAGCSSLKEITIPNSVTSIGAFAFYGCSSLKEIKIPPSVKNIGDCAFGDGISKIIISNSEQISRQIFTFNKSYPNNTTLKNVILLEGVTDIPEYTFRNCTSLTSVTIPSTVTSIGGDAFYGCENLVNVIIPEGVKYINGGTFENCKALTSVTIPSTVTEIGKSAFRDCENLVNVIISEGVEYINDYTFENCKALTSVTIPSTVTSIGVAVFYGCENLVNVTIPESVTYIGSNAFENCESLKSLIIPGNITEINDHAFASCKNLTEVTFLDPISNLKKRCISRSAFYDCSSLTNITLPQKHYLYELDYSYEYSSKPFDPSNWKNVKITYTISTNNTFKNSENSTPKISTNNPFENSANFTPHITKGEMDITTKTGKYYMHLCIEGNTGAQNKDNSDYWEAACISNSQMQEFIQSGNNISFATLGDGNDWVIRFVLYDEDDKPIYYDYKFSTKNNKYKGITIKYEKLKPADKSVKHKFNKNEVRDIIISGNNPGKETARSLWIYAVKVY